MDRTIQQSKQPKRILFLLSLPDTSEFQKYAADRTKCVQAVESLGVTTCTEISSRTLGMINRYDVVVVVAHLDEERNELVLSDSRMDIATFVNSLPVDFHGIMDFSSCYSAQWINGIKTQCPQCHVLGAKGQTTLPFRLYIYPYVMQFFMESPDVEYKDAYIAVQNFVKETMLAQSQKDDGDDNIQATKLGKKMSSVYAPTQVARGNAFMVQLFIHDETESSQKITIQARKYDPKTHLVETKELDVKLKKGDKIAVRFSVFSAQPECFTLESPVKIMKWDGKMAKFQFNAIVSPDFHADSFIGTLLIEVDHEPVGECSFTIAVADRKDEAPAPVAITPRDRYTDGEKGRLKLRQQLIDNLDKLLHQQENTGSNETNDSLNNAINTCKLCIHLIDNPIQMDADSKPKKVFVSSTCEDFMKPYRNCVRDAVVSLKMAPEMCDYWPQSGCNPTHVCCQKVLDSDIYLGVFGGRYGYVEPSLNSSMTQVEYMTALSAKKRMLLFVINPLNETDEPESIRHRQDEFIEDLKKSRILRTFHSIDELSDLIKNDLLDIISKK